MSGIWSATEVIATVQILKPDLTSLEEKPVPLTLGPGGDALRLTVVNVSSESSIIIKLHSEGEFDFRYNTRVSLEVNDTGRTDSALQAVVGKRLTYRTTRCKVSADQR